MKDEQERMKGKCKKKKEDEWICVDASMCWVELKCEKHEDQHKQKQRAKTGRKEKKK